MKMTFKNIADYVYDYLFEKIANDNLIPEQKIDIDAICVELGVSRTPVKEALIYLGMEGYLEKLPRRGYVVRKLTPNTFVELLACLGTLEGMAASLAVPQIKEPELIVMKKNVEEMGCAIQNKDQNKYFELQKDFHEIFISCCGNDELKKLIIFLNKRFFKQDYKMHKSNDELYEALKKINEEHRQIILLLEKGDKAGLEKFLREVHWVSHIAG